MTSLFAGLLLLCVLVVIHELGHFLVAKALGVRVLTFSLGFGPKIVKWTWGGTEICVSAIPLGGYVKMVGESPLDELTDAEKKVSFLHQALWKKSAIALAGPLFNLILPIILFWFVFFGNEVFLRPIVGATVPGDVAALAGVQPGDVILQIDGIPVETFNDVTKEISARPERKISLSLERQIEGKTQKRVIEVLTNAVPDPNPINIGEKVGRIGIVPSVRRAKIGVLDSGSPAALAGLKTFDEVVSINSQPVASFEDLALKLKGQNQIISIKIERKEKDKKEPLISDFKIDPSVLKSPSFSLATDIQRFAVDESDVLTAKYQESLAATKKIIQEQGATRHTMLGVSFADSYIGSVQDDSAAAKVGLLRGDKIVSLNGVRVESWFQIQNKLESNQDGWQMFGVMRGDTGRIVSLRLRPASDKTSAYELPTSKVLGAFPEEIFGQGATGERHIGAIAALSRGLQSTWDLIKMTGKSLWLLVSFSVPASQLGGPIMIFDVAGQAASQSLEYYVFVMSLVSVNLGLLNLLPVPVLDGGHLMMFFIEFVIRRPLSLKVRQIATQIGMALVLGLMSLAIFNDIARLLS